ncbi:MAG: thymidylate synthase [Acinetobacter sp.]
MNYHLDFNNHAMQQILKATVQMGEQLTARGSTFKEIEGYQLTIFSKYPFMMFPSRKYNIDYFKQEMLWKLTGDPFNDSIKQKAKMWESVQNTDGSFNSNYGQYWFGEQLGLHKAFNELIVDRQTRRATIPMLRAEHIGHGVNDTVCTGHITFHIRKDNELNALVSMRSSDQIFGLGTDIPTFAALHRMLLGMLHSVYPDVVLGKILITADSSHIYNRHYKMVDTILENNETIGLYDMPLIDTAEAFKLAACKGNVDPSWGKFSAWLLETSNG